MPDKQGGTERYNKGVAIVLGVGFVLTAFTILGLQIGAGAKYSDNWDQSWTGFQTFASVSINIF